MAIKLCDSSDSDGDDISNIQINQKFARRYEHNKKREDLQRLQELENNGFVDDESSEDVSEDDGVDDCDLADALIKIRRKDPILKHKDTVLFDSNNNIDDDEVSDDEKVEKNPKEKVKTYLKDLPAKHLNEDGEAMGDDEEDDEEMVVSGGKSYVEEQEELTKPFLEDDEEDDGGGFFKPKVRSHDDDEEEDDDEEGEVGKKLDEYFGPDEKLDENEKYIKEYIRKKMWLDKSDRKVFDEDDDIGVSDDEEEVERQEDYEREFNFRFEEDPVDRVLGHSRVVEGSVRKKSNTRKLQRERKEERIAQAEYERKEELKKWKNVKKKEMNEKLKKIRETAGIGEGGVCMLDLDDLEDEFVPEEYDRKMKVTFDEGYYEANDADPDFASDGSEDDIEKPDFDKEDELLGLPKGWDDMDSSRDGFKAAREMILKQRVEKEGVVDAAESEQKKKQKMSALEKEVLNEQLDEYYKLDYEDTIGDLKTRFRYRPVNAKRFGLKTKEVLLLDDKDLNQHVPLKKLAPYREKEWKVPRIKIYNQKMKIKSLLEGETSDVHNTGKRKYRDEETSKDVGKLYQEESKSSKRRHRQASIKLSQSRLKAYGKVPSKSKSKRQN